MTRLRWWGRIIVEHLGWPGLLALLVVATSLSYHGYGVATQPRLVIAADAPRAAPPAPSPDAVTRTELDALENKLNTASLEENLQTLHDSGRKAGLELRKLEYRMAEEKRWRLRQYQIVVPVSGTYPKIREFVGIALADIPALALDHLSFQKKKVEDATVDAELRFTLLTGDVR